MRFDNVIYQHDKHLLIWQFEIKHISLQYTYYQKAAGHNNTQPCPYLRVESIQCLQEAV